MSEGGTGGGQQLNADVVAMEVASTQLQESRDELGSAVRVLGARVSETSTVWKSDGAMEFTNIMERWTHNANQLNQALDEIAEAVRTGGRSYEETAANQAAELKNTGSVLSGDY
ncbi:WXG100 family type VII secretion target [Rhodococcus sp. SMB37]|uniref:WXG100 family type VII secretion target n=1 Tax=Rhodococcus sp. SMB37 TaxID=2512213 RepID=UPI000A89281E|nr:WXG100 family type VII secretion target [Rhodococcus sp. SMB37]TCN57289.1 WXG100 family type VII secretion target [Rhodococcus sp. SMB37]